MALDDKTLFRVLRNGGITRQVAQALLDKFASSGGSVPDGTPIVRAFPIAFDTAGLVTGYETWTPAVGDVLLDAWVSIVTAWDGTTPSLDIGPFDTETSGWFAWQAAALNLEHADDDEMGSDNTSFLISQNGGSTPLWSSSLAWNANFGQSASGDHSQRVLPARFAESKPIKVVVTTDGTTDGDDPGATHGAAILYLVTATPASA